MGKWSQLVEHTGEYTPGPYGVAGANVNTGNVLKIIAEERNEGIARVSPTKAGRYLEMLDGRLSESWEDPEQEATGRLMAEAPDMLALLARWLDWVQHYPGMPEPVRAAGALLTSESASLVARHVRIGYEPPTARETAARSDPPPPPPAPTFFDEWPG